MKNGPTPEFWNYLGFGLCVMLMLVGVKSCFWFG